MFYMGICWRRFGFGRFSLSDAPIHWFMLKTRPMLASRKSRLLLMTCWLNTPPKPVRMDKGVLGRWKEKLLLTPYIRFILLKLSMVITHFGATVKSMSRFKELVNRMVGWKKVMSSAEIRLIG